MQWKNIIMMADGDSESTWHDLPERTGTHEPAQQHRQPQAAQLNDCKGSGVYLGFMLRPSP